MKRRKFVKGLAKKHKRESKLKESLKSMLKKAVEKAKKPVISLKSDSLKGFNVEYEHVEVQEDFQQDSKAVKTQKRQESKDMLERLKDIYKI